MICPVHYYRGFLMLYISVTKTRTVRVRVPYLHCTGAARTQISYFRGTGPSKKEKFWIFFFFFYFFTVKSENIALLNQIFFRTS